MAGVQSIERAFAVLRELSLGPAGVTDIADRVDLPKSTVSRLLSALEGEGAVQQRPQSTEYELAEATGEATGFVVRSGRNVYWADNVEQSDEAVQVKDRTGFYAPMHSVPAGVALLAHLPVNEIESYLAQPLERVNDRTPSDIADLRCRIAQIAADGVLWSFDDLGEGITAIDVPFRGASGQYEGALFVNAPSYRFPAEGDKERIQQLVVDAAVRLSGRFKVH